LHEACSKGHAEIAGVLIRRGADVRARNINVFPAIFIITLSHTYCYTININ